jgi:nucleotide-binding universal stress UspA family protein
MYKTILVPIDLGHPEIGGKTLEIARSIGGKQSRIAALYVTADVPGFVAIELPKGLLQKELVNARAKLKALADEVGAESKVVTGHPPVMILDYAKEIGADLIVIASHRPGLQDYFLGSTAARVVRHAECAVLVDR